MTSERVNPLTELYQIASRITPLAQKSSPPFPKTADARRFCWKLATVNWKMVSFRSHSCKAALHVDTCFCPSSYSLLSRPSPESVVPADIDAYVERSMKAFEVPGLSLAVVKDGKVVYAKGYGVRKLSDPAPVSENTLFGIASNTKAFTAAALAILVDEGKLSWMTRSSSTCRRFVWPTQA